MNKNTFLFVAALFWCWTTTLSQNNFLDTTFGDNGVILQYYNGSDPPGNYESEFKVMVVQPDGKIITGSDFHQHGPNRRYVINQYNSDGTLNTGFGTDGFVVSNLNNAVGALQLQTDGKIIASSFESNYSSSFSYLIRYNADGSLDSSFGVDGTVIDALHTIKSFSIQSDDKIVVVKSSESYGFSASVKIERYNSDGIPDTGFGANGKIELVLTQLRVLPQNITIQNDGKIVISGLSRSNDINDYSNNIFLMRLDNNGSLDPSFSDQGIKIFDYGYYENLYDLLIQSDGKFFFSSSSSGSMPENEPIKRLMRLNADGSLDNTFGVNGVVIIDYPILSVQSIQQLTSGKLIVAGIYETSINPTPQDNPTPTAIIVARYDVDGDLDLNFGVDGYIKTPVDLHRVLNDKLVVQSDGKILVGATLSNPWFSTHPRAAVLRYNPNQVLSSTEFENETDFLLYPNPVKDVATLEFRLLQPKVLSIDLYDSNGRLISNLLKNQSFSQGANSHKLYLPGILANGVYFLSVSTKTNTTNIKLIKS